jgi:integrase/recombinase XerD
MSLKPNSYDLASCREFYLQYCAAKGQSLKTIDGKAFNLILFEQWCCARNHKDYANICVDELDSYQASLNGYRKPKDAQPLSRGTIRQRLTLAKVFLRSFTTKI